MSNMDFYLVKLSQNVRGYTAPLIELNHPQKSFMTFKMIVFSRLEISESGLFAYISDIRPYGLPVC